MIKILHLIKSLGRGGAETLLPETLRAHDRKRFDFAYGYFLDYKNQVAPELEKQGATVRCFRANNSAAILAKSGEVARFAKDWGADIIHCHLPVAGVAGRIAGKLAGIPVVYTEHNKQERYHPLTRKANLVTVGWNELVLSVSENVESSLKKATAGKEISVQTLLNGVDTAKFDDAQYDKTSAKEALSIPGNAPVVGTVAVFRDQKRLHLWLDLAKKISAHFPETYFILVGDGPHFEALRRQATELGIAEKTIFPGRLEEVRPWLAAMDVYLMTSEFEGLPIAMLEAMSMRLPVVSTTAGGISEVVRAGEEGFLAPVHDYAALLDPLLQLLKDENLRKQTGTNARRRVETAFSIERMAHELETVYLDILKKKDQK